MAHESSVDSRSLRTSTHRNVWQKGSIKDAISKLNSLTLALRFIRLRSASQTGCRPDHASLEMEIPDRSTQPLAHIPFSPAVVKTRPISVSRREWFYHAIFQAAQLQ